MSTGAMGIIKDDKMILIKNDTPVQKLVDFIIQFSHQNNLIIMSGLKTNGLYTTPLLSTNPEANMSVHSSHFANMQELVYYFTLSLIVRIWRRIARLSTPKKSWVFLLP